MFPSKESKVENDKIVEIFEQGVEAGKDLTFEADLMIPECAMTSNSKICGIIEVSYEFKVVAVTPGCHLDFETIIPITVLSAPMGAATRVTHSNVVFTPIRPITPTAPPMFDSRKQI